MKEFLRQYAFSIFITFITIYITIILVMMLWQYNPIRIDGVKLGYSTVEQGQKVHHQFVGTPEMEQGNQVCFQFTGQKFYNIPVEASVEMVNGETIHIMKYISNNPIGTIFKWRCYQIPYSIPPGKWQIRWSGVYHMNALNNVYRSKDSGYLTVLDKDIHRQGPKGDVGQTGKKGVKGDRGDKGDTGNTSLFGRGPKGDKGDPGKDRILKK